MMTYVMNYVTYGDMFTYTLVIIGVVALLLNSKRG
jgi:hypothetical protein